MRKTLKAMTETEPKKFITIQDLMQRLRQQDSIPALDENVLQLSRMTSHQNTSAADLTAVIMRDAALTSRLLTIANSATYRPRHPVRTVSSAVVLFGFQRIHQLAVGLSIFHKHTEEARDKELYRLLVCAYCTGNLALHLANAIHVANPEEFFVAGLLRQLPRLVLANGYPKLYTQMEDLVTNHKCSIDEACETVFGLPFSEITQAIAEYWHLNDANSQAISPKDRDQKQKSIELAIDISDLLFGNKPTGPQAVGLVTDALRDFLKKPQLSLPEFVGTAASGDPNIADFFNLSSEDMVMMTRIAEWGKVSSTDVANSLTNSLQKAPQKSAEEAPPLMMAHFLSELMLAIRDRYSFSDILMIAQEGIFRCIPCECVIISFMDRERNALHGRLYAGRIPGIAASRCRVSLASTTALAARNGRGKDAEIVTASPKHNILDNDTLLKELNVHEVMLVPILAGGRTIGQFLLARKASEPPFSPDDTLWMNAIASHIGLSFEQGS